MTFLLRAALVIGALSYLALMRGGGEPAVEAKKLAGGLPGVQAAQATYEAVPAEVRERAMRDGLARGLIAELSRRAGAAEPASQDTLERSDRQPAWRGAELR